MNRRGKAVDDHRPGLDRKGACDALGHLCSVSDGWLQLRSSGQVRQRWGKRRSRMSRPPICAGRACTQDTLLLRGAATAGAAGDAGVRARRGILLQDPCRLVTPSSRLQSLPAMPCGSGRCWREPSRRPQTSRGSLAFLYSRLMVCLNRVPPGDTSPRHRIDRKIAAAGALHLSA